MLMKKKELWNIINSDKPEFGYNYLFHELVIILSQQYGVKISKMLDIFKFCAGQDNEAVGTIVSHDFKDKVYDKSSECYICGEKNNLTIHHIQPKNLYPEEKYNIDNVILLCDKCHKLIHESDNDGNRKNI